MNTRNDDLADSFPKFPDVSMQIIRVCLCDPLCAESAVSTLLKSCFSDNMKNFPHSHYDLHILLTEDSHENKAETEEGRLDACHLTSLLSDDV